MTQVNLQEVIGKERDYSIVPVARMTVATFSKILDRRLYLTNGPLPPVTDGNQLRVELRHPLMYQLTELLLAHIVFKSDAIAKDKFVKEYCLRVAKMTKGADLSGPLTSILTILERERVLGLWGRVYAGSESILRQYFQSKLQGRPPTSLIEAFQFVSVGHVLKNEFQEYQPLFQEALGKVEGRGFSSTLITAKWLITQLLDRLLEEAPEKSRPEAAQQLSEEPQATTKETYDRSKLASSDDVASSENTAKKALLIDVKGDITQVLNDSRPEMEEAVAVLASSAKSSLCSSDWMRKDIKARVVFQDITVKDLPKDLKINVSEEDMESVRRLRSHFYKILGRRSEALEIEGVELDIEAYIEAKTSGTQLPMFREEVAGRGFRALLLVDRSTSMREYGKAPAAERACRMIRRALDFPFVTTEIWGFHGEFNEIRITKFDPGMEVFDTPKSRITGSTPLHLAVELATRQLSHGTEVKHLFVITDGLPLFQGRLPNGDIGWLGSKKMMNETAKEVRKARAKGIGVTGFYLGSIKELSGSEKEFSSMLGTSQHWRFLQPDTFGKDLLNLVGSSFSRYLRTR